MILIGDSGSTKTDWRVIDNGGKIQQLKSPGLNPNYQSAKEISEALLESLTSLRGSKMDFIYFYGSGCDGSKNIQLLTGVFQSVFPHSQVEINHDLLAAARALCNQDPGIACILGTGSNSCLYDGKAIIDHVPSMGYLVGDEGSGSVLGKKLVGDYFKRQLPHDLEEKFVQRYHPEEHDVLNHLYQEPYPNRYLASYSKFLFDNQNHSYIYELIYQEFLEFMKRNVMNYQGYRDYPVHFLGSIAFYYADILRQVGNDHQITVKNIVESPIAGLTLYHQAKIQKL